MNIYTVGQIVAICWRPVVCNKVIRCIHVSRTCTFTQKLSYSSRTGRTCWYLL